MIKARMKEGAVMLNVIPTKQGVVLSATFVEEVREGSINMSPWMVDTLDRPTFVRSEERKKFERLVDSLPLPRKID